jgi:hypothetical protein
MYHQGASIRQLRVEAAIHVLESLSSVPSLLMSFCQSFFLPIFAFLTWRFIVFSSFFYLVFYHSLFPPFIFVLILSMFLAHVVLSLAYPTCLRLKGLVVVVMCCRPKKKSANIQRKMK